VAIQAAQIDQSGPNLMDIKPIDWETHVKPWTGIASRERVALGDTNGNEWFGAFDGDDLAAIAFMRRRGSKVRLGGMFTHPDYRGRGFGDALTKWRIDRAVSSFASMIDCYSVNPPYWVELGFRNYGQNAHGVIRLVKIV